MLRFWSVFGILRPWRNGKGMLILRAPGRLLRNGIVGRSDPGASFVPPLRQGFPEGVKVLEEFSILCLIRRLLKAVKDEEHRRQGVPRVWDIHLCTSRGPMVTPSSSTHMKPSQKYHPSLKRFLSPSLGSFVIGNASIREWEKEKGFIRASFRTISQRGTHTPFLFGGGWWSLL